MEIVVVAVVDPYVQLTINSGKENQLNCLVRLEDIMRGKETMPALTERQRQAVLARVYASKAVKAARDLIRYLGVAENASDDDDELAFDIDKIYESLAPIIQRLNAYLSEPFS